MNYSRKSHELFMIILQGSESDSDNKLTEFEVEKELCRI